MASDRNRSEKVVAEIAREVRMRGLYRSLDAVDQACRRLIIEPTDAQARQELRGILSTDLRSPFAPYSTAWEMADNVQALGKELAQRLDSGDVFEIRVAAVQVGQAAVWLREHVERLLPHKFGTLP